MVSPQSVSYADRAKKGQYSNMSRNSAPRLNSTSHQPQVLTLNSKPPVAGLPSKQSSDARVNAAPAHSSPDSGAYATVVEGDDHTQPIPSRKHETSVQQDGNDAKLGPSRTSVSPGPNVWTARQRQIDAARSNPPSPQLPTGESPSLRPVSTVLTPIHSNHTRPNIPFSSKNSNQPSTSHVPLSSSNTNPSQRNPHTTTIPSNTPPPPGNEVATKSSATQTHHTNAKRHKPDVNGSRTTWGMTHSSSSSHSTLRPETSIPVVSTSAGGLTPNASNSQTQDASAKESINSPISERTGKHIYISFYKKCSPDNRHP